MSACDRCGRDVLTTPDGRHLNPKRSRLGRYLTDGTELTPNEQRQKGASGHFQHICSPLDIKTHQTTTDNPTTLF